MYQTDYSEDTICNLVDDYLVVNGILELRLFKCCVCEENPAKWVNECFNMYCSYCLRQMINNATCYPVKCVCFGNLSDYECYKVLKKENHKRYRNLQVSKLLIQENELFKCFNEKCCGTFKKKDNQISSRCSRCNSINCTKCLTIHSKGETCEIWQRNNSNLFENKKQMQIENEKKIEANKGMYCLDCGLFIEKDGGCDNLCCPACGLVICYITKKRRWGPKGFGDISDGCRCMVNSTKCHPDCTSCTI